MKIKTAGKSKFGKVVGKNFQLSGKKPEKTDKTADISRRHHWFPREVTSEKRAQKSRTYMKRPTTRIWVVFLLTGWKFASKISALASQTSFGGETSGDVAKCRLFSKPTSQRCVSTCRGWWQYSRTYTKSHLSTTATLICLGRQSMNWLLFKSLYKGNGH